jgi:hypothetical protein
MTPYELRFEIFKQAYHMLSDEFCNKFDVAREWNEKVGKLELELPEFPSLNQVLKQAEIINDFVSSK